MGGKTVLILGGGIGGLAVGPPPRGGVVTGGAAHSRGRKEAGLLGMYGQPVDHDGGEEGPEGGAARTGGTVERRHRSGPRGRSVDRSRREDRSDHSRQT